MMPRICEQCEEELPSCLWFTAVLKIQDNRELLECHCLCLQRAGPVATGGWTPLSLAARRNHQQCIRSLVQAGADVNDGALGIALECSHKECVDLLIESGADVNAGDPCKLPLIAAAKEFRFKGCVETLLKAGADVNIRGLNNITSLMYAVERGDHDMVYTLITAGADVNHEDSVGMTPLMRAINGQNMTGVNQLINAGADVNKVTNFVGIQSSALALASEINPSVVELLIKEGADVNIPFRQGGNLAFGSHCTLGCTRLLLKAGAKINIYNNHNINTLKRYIGENRQGADSDICRLFLAAGETLDGPTVETRDFFAGSVQHVTIPEYILKEVQVEKLCLSELCRVAIRKSLLDINPQENLIVRVPRLGLPVLLARYLLFDVPLTDVK